MPYVACYCEQVIGLSALPLPNGLALATEPRLEEALSRAAELLERQAGNTEEQQRGLWDLFYFGNPALQRAVQCPNCGRLLVLNENEGIVMSFAPELGVEVADEGRSSRGFSPTDTPAPRAAGAGTGARRAPVPGAVVEVISGR